MDHQQQAFNQMIGDLDEVLSKMILCAIQISALTHHEISPNYQTLKHHAEDMIGAGEKILKLLGVKDDPA